MTTEDQDVKNTYYLFDKIDRDSAKDVIEWIMDANKAEVKYEFLTLIINSDGGELSHALAITDMMKTSSIPVRTIGMGEIQSSGLMIFIAGQKGNRILMPSTNLMSHRFSAGADGKFHELQASNRNFKILHEMMINHYVEHTGLTKAKVEKQLLPHHDVYMTAQDAVELGCADLIG